VLTCVGAGGGAFGFHQGQGFAVVAPQHIVHIAFAAVVGHSLHFDFGGSRLLGVPSGFLQSQIDEVAAGVGFVVVVAGRFGGAVLGDQGIPLGFGLGQFGFGLAGAVFGQAAQCFGLGQLLGQGLQLLAAQGGVRQ
jgi:hypothetical protein